MAQQKVYDGKVALLALCLKHANDWNSVYQDISTDQILTDEDLLRAESFTGNYISILDAEYPKRLMHRYKPPFVLYYDGDLDVLKKVDDEPNRLIFLHGPNTFGIPEDNLVTIDDDNKVNVCGRLKVWFVLDNKNPDRFGLAAALAQTLVGTKVYDIHSRSWFVGLAVTNALDLGGDVYMVPTDFDSFNKKLIDEGANPITSLSDLSEVLGGN